MLVAEPSVVDGPTDFVTGTDDDPVALGRYAWRRLVFAYRLGQRHHLVDALCACGNGRPCVHARTIEEHTARYEDAFAALFGPTQVVPTLVAPLLPAARMHKPGRRLRFRWAR